jgi:hypothetical protein
MRGLLALLLFPTVSSADHLPDRLVIQGQAETTLGGIDIHRSTASSLLKTFGKPASDEKYPKTEEAREIIWAMEGFRIHATINVNDIAYAVDISGKPGSLAKTGSGLGLGQTLSDLKRIYGTRFSKRGNDVTLQWRDGTEMRAKLLNARIVSLTLIAQVE